MFKIGDKVVCTDPYATFPSLKLGHNYIVDDVNNVSGEEAIWVSHLGCWYRASHFKLAEEKAKQISFKDFLSPMCRVELRNGDMAIHINGDIVGESIHYGHVSSRLDDGKHEYYMRCPANTLIEVIRVYAPPAHTRHILNPKEVGELLWESPEIVAVRKVKEQKVAEIQKEIKEWAAKRESSLLQANSATSVINDLEKQLKEIQ